MAFFSDSLLCNENKDDAVSDIESCFEVQCNQVFIGMVTMQYQAQTDMVRYYYSRLLIILLLQTQYIFFMTTGTIDRTIRQSVYKICPLQQRERVALTCFLGENGSGERLELPHLVTQRRS